jgi:hypothetical protein
MKGAIHIPRVALLAALLTAACLPIAEPPQTPFISDNDSRPCARNLIMSGDPVAGFAFRTHEERSGSAPSDVFRQAGRELAARGYTIQSSSPESGIISSTAGNGAVTINVVVEAVKGTASGTRVDLRAQLRSGATTAPAAVLREFCDIISATLAP